MITYEMDQYTVQSYFKSLCKSFAITYKEVKRFESMLDELESTCKEEELKLVTKLIEIPIGEFAQRYIKVNFSTDELKARKEYLEHYMEEYNKKSGKLESIRYYWADTMWNDVYVIIKKVIKSIKDMNFSIIITSKEEIITLMEFYRNYSVLAHNIINTDPQYLVDFPKDEMSQEFLKAYCNCLETNSETAMEEVVRKYF